MSKVTRHEGTGIEIRHTTSRKDQAGHVELLNFDRATGLYSVGQMVEPITQVFESQDDDEGDDSMWEEWTT